MFNLLIDSNFILKCKYFYIQLVNKYEANWMLSEKKMSGPYRKKGSSFDARTTDTSLILYGPNSISNPK